MKRILLFLLLLAGAGSGAYLYYFKSNVSENLKNEYIKIPTGTDFESLVQQLVTGGYIEDESNFRQWASWHKFSKVRAGRFKIKGGWSSHDLVKFLQRGEQSPVKVVLNYERTPAQIAGKVARVLERDSLKFLEAFNNTVLLDSLNIKPELLLCYFVPNTYEMFWNTEPDKFVERMYKEFKRFWNESRLEKAKAQNLTPEQAAIMASIVDGETRFEDEKPMVAAAYLNRLKRNIRLQADPTVQFALMDIEKTHAFRRLFNRDYETPHPYNTYMNDGLPPGPICMASTTSIDAVLNPADNNYIYFCAKPDNTGKHNFAETYEQHLVNVKIYQTWLRNQK
jgi:UPF0755 protein